MFKVGDRVQCVRPANTNMEKYIGNVATVVGVDHCGDLFLSYPFWLECLYTPEQFVLFEDVQENE